jgi:predicted nuclease with TOPRIM domain
MPYILKDLNSQRAEVRAGVAQQITRFSEQYEAQPVLKKRFDVQQDPQKELLKEDLALREAIKRLKATRAELQDSVGSLEAQLHEREERLTA